MVRYPEARAIQRKVVFHAGPTNSGKTYHAIQRYLAAKSGVYCGPLKLLAHEIFEKSNTAVRIGFLPLKSVPQKKMRMHFCHSTLNIMAFETLSISAFCRQKQFHAGSCIHFESVKIITLQNGDRWTK